MPNKNLLEGEVVEPRRKQHDQRSSYEKSQQPLSIKRHSSGVLLLNVTAVLLSWIPIIGLGIAALALIVSLVRHANVLLPILALVISSSSTTIFIILAGLLSLIF